MNMLRFLYILFSILNKIWLYDILKQFTIISFVLYIK